MGVAGLEVTPPLPRTVADLAQWQVYADHLLERGEPLGAFLSHELAMRSSPTKHELEVFHAEARRFCRSPRIIRVAWMLGHARSLVVIGNPSRRLRMSREPPDLPLDLHEVKQLRRIVQTPICSRLEAIDILLDPQTASAWRSVVACLPASCTRIGLNPRWWSEDDTKRVLDSLSAPIKTIAVWPHGASLAEQLIDSRFEEIDARGGTVDLRLAEVLRQRLEDQPGVRLRIGSVTGRDVLELLGPRVVVGNEGDAALVHERTGAIRLLARPSVLSLQLRSGVITALAQVNRSIIETYRLRDVESGLQVPSDQLVRRSDGSWSARLRPDDDIESMTVDGQPVGFEPVRVVNGSLVEVDGQPYRFVERFGRE